METPILLLAYNRPEKTERVLQRLAECNAHRVYVSFDGPKNQKDSVHTDQVRSITSKYDSIVIQTRESTSNLGCKNAVLSGIDWFFSHVEEGIILEDDCLPGSSFFEFVNKLLELYRHRQTVHMISGNNPLGEWHTEQGHLFSRIGHVWGWATWKDRWQSFNPELPKLQNFVISNGFERAFGPTELAASRKMLTQDSIAGKIDTWDYQWNAHMLMNDGLAAIPEKNLIENIGFGDDGTHTDQVPNWISNKPFDDSIKIEATNFLADREYEMELFLSQRSNAKALSNSMLFHKKGGGGLNSFRVVIVNSTDIGGGAEKITLSIHKCLVELGHQSTLLVEKKKTDLDTVIEIANNWKDQILSLNPEIIHVHNLHGTSFSLSELASLSKSTPVLFTLHDSWLTTGSDAHPYQLKPSQLNLLESKRWKRLLAQRKEQVENSDIRWTAPSQWMRERFFLSHGIRPYFVPNAADSSNNENVEIPSDQYILFVANRPEENPYKDFETLKKAWKTSNDKLKADGLDLICLGSSDTSTEDFGGNKLYLIEKQDNAAVGAFIQKALLVVQASVQDNAPLVVLESHTLGKRVLGSIAGGIPELMDKMEQSWLYEPGNAEDLSNKLIEAIKTSEKIPKLPQNPDLISSDKMVDTYLGHYRDLVNG